MRGFTSLPRPVLLAVALLFAAAVVLHVALWVYIVTEMHGPDAGLGIDLQIIAPGRYLFVVDEVQRGGAAEKAGLKPGDSIVEVNGEQLEAVGPLLQALTEAQPGETVELTVERPGLVEPLTVPLAFSPAGLSWTDRVEFELIRFYPAVFALVGLLVLFLRLEDRNAWLLALLLAGLNAPNFPYPIELAPHPLLSAFVAFYSVVFSLFLPALFYHFFAVFPVPSPLEHRWPWLKWVLLAVAAALAVPLGVLAVQMNNPWLVHVLPRAAAASGGSLLLAAVGAQFTAGFGLGVVSLLWNRMRAPSAEARRKIRVIVWGTVSALALSLLLLVRGVSVSLADRSFGFKTTPFAFLPLLLIPVSFAYAVAKHRVLEIPVLLKRSARYLLVQRGFLLLLVLVSFVITLGVASVFSGYFQVAPGGDVRPGVGVGAALGIALVWAGAHVRKRVTQRIDRAFFRSAYDARQILQDLVEKTRAADNRQELAALLARHVRKALHPKFLTVYLESSRGSLVAEAGRVVPGLETLPAAHPVLADIARQGRPWEVPPLEAGGATALMLLGPLAADCMVPILGRDARLTGLLVLGERLSEEPYSGEDKRLLDAVAGQAGIALESIHLGERIAERLEAERRATREMEIAQQVQGNLFPRKTPPLRTLEYAGDCIQARQVGGDYYDFLELGKGRVGFAVADIVGKGISAALLMASLQANLRSQYVVALDDLPRLMESVNRLFYASTAPHYYATFFFGDYDDATRRLGYANCGHNPPVLLRADGSVERLAATATVLGLFDVWECDIAETALAPGDTLVVYTDGVTEAMSDDGEEFGEARLLEAIRAHRHLPAADLLRAIAATVEEFTGVEQEDDLTLLVAHAR